MLRSQEGVRVSARSHDLPLESSCPHLPKSVMAVADLNG